MHEDSTTIPAKAAATDPIIPAAKPATTTLEAPMTSEQAGELLLRRGMHNTPLANARSTATYAGYIAIVPLLYFLWTTFGQLTGLQFGPGSLSIALAVVSEAARWIVSGFVFGLMYRELPGRIGPIKGLWFAGLWAAASLVPTAVARGGLNVDMAQQVVYRTAQFALFIIVLAVLSDLAVIRQQRRTARGLPVPAGISFRDLQNIYSLQSYGQVAAALTPALLLVVTLAQQIAQGSPLDVAKSFFDGSVLK